MTKQESGYQSILERLENVEGRYRVLRRAGLLILAIGAAAVAMALTSPQELSIAVQELRIVDSEGQVLARLGIDQYEESRTASLGLFWTVENDTARVGAMLAGDGRMLLGDTTAGVSLDGGAGVASVRLLGNGADAASLYAQYGGEVGLRLNDAKGELRTWLRVDKNTTSLRLEGPNEDRLVMDVRESPGITATGNAPTLLLFDREGNLIWQAPF